MITYRHAQIFLIVFAIAMLIALTAIPANACPSCYGDARSSRFDGMNAAILTMIGITGTVFAGFGGFFISMRKRMHSMHDSGHDSDMTSGPRVENSTDTTLS